MQERWYTININPEPWAIGTAHRGGISPNPNLVTYQAAVREELEDESHLPPEMRRLTFYFFRQIERYIDAADHRQTRNIADATNCQKALEDALQGILFDNDREIVDIRSVMVMQGKNVDPGFTVIHAERVFPSLHGADEIPADLLEQAFKGPTEHLKKQTRWQGADDLF